MARSVQETHIEIQDRDIIFTIKVLLISKVQWVNMINKENINLGSWQIRCVTTQKANNYTSFWPLFQRSWRNWESTQMLLGDAWLIISDMLIRILVLSYFLIFGISNFNPFQGLNWRYDYFFRIGYPSISIEQLSSFSWQKWTDGRYLQYTLWTFPVWLDVRCKSFFHPRGSCRQGSIRWRAIIVYRSIHQNLNKWCDLIAKLAGKFLQFNGHRGIRFHQCWVRFPFNFNSP